jgi:ribonucleoside-diphosphate reductase alpha chain
MGKVKKEIGRPKTTNATLNDPNANSQISKFTLDEPNNIEKNIKNYSEFISWCRWYPDLFLDLIKPKKGGIILHLDQRIFLRTIMRFTSFYGVFPRSYAKTFNEVLCLVLTAILFPRITLAITAQTQQNAAKLLKDKYSEIIEFYPMLESEIIKKTFSKDEAELIFINKSVINILANSDTSKGQRRKRIAIEESALLNNVVFDDALKPIVDTPRRTIGEKATVNPEEMNQQINFFTTSGFRASYEYSRCLNMANAMKELKGVMVLGADWHLGCWYQRGLSKPQILQTKEEVSPISFARNYCSKWVGATDGALVDIQKLLNTRTLLEAESKGDFNCEYYLGVDVARSIKTGNNLSAVGVIKVIRNPQGRIKECHLVNIFEISNISNFTTQAVEIKKIKRLFNARITCIDTNGLGIGLHDELLKESFDPITGESLGCWDTINTDAVPELQNAERCLYDLKPQSSNSQVITTFIDMVYSGKLRLLIKKSNSDYDVSDLENQKENVLPFVLTDSLIEETANLKLKTLSGGRLGIEMVIKGYNKDKFSALEYVLWYVQTFEDNVSIKEEDITGLLACIMT